MNPAARLVATGVGTVTLVRRGVWLTTAVVLVLGIGTAGADTYPRQPGIDVTHYVFRLTLTDESDAVEGEATVHVRILDEGISALTLDLAQPSEAESNRGMTVTAVTEGGTPLEWTHSSDRLGILLAPPGRRDERRQIVVRYGGIPAKGLVIGPNTHGDRTFFSDNWPNKARHWLPTIDHPLDKATCEMVVTAPDHYQAISNGLLVEETDLGNGQRRTHWRQSVPISPWLYVLGVAGFAVEHRPAWRGIPIQTWVYPQDRDTGFEVFAEPTVAVLEFLNHRVGPYPYEKLAQVQSNSVRGGMESATAIFYGPTSTTGERPDRWRNVIIHEIAHQWFGNAVTEDDWDHVWLSEGFATYFTHLFKEHTEGRDVLVARMRDDKEIIRAFDEDRPDYRIVHDNLSDMRRVVTSAGTYKKGAWVLHMLRGVVGDAAFWDGIRVVLRALPKLERLHRRLPPGDGGRARRRARLVLRPVVDPRRDGGAAGLLVVGCDSRDPPSPGRADPGVRSLPHADRGGNRRRGRAACRADRGPWAKAELHVPRGSRTAVRGAGSPRLRADGHRAHPRDSPGGRRPVALSVGAARRAWPPATPRPA